MVLERFVSFLFGLPLELNHGCQFKENAINQMCSWETNWQCGKFSIGLILHYLKWYFSNILQSLISTWHEFTLFLAAFKMIQHKTYALIWQFKQRYQWKSTDAWEQHSRTSFQLISGTSLTSHTTTDNERALCMKNYIL